MRKIFYEMFILNINIINYSQEKTCFLTIVKFILNHVQYCRKVTINRVIIKHNF